MPSSTAPILEIAAFAIASTVPIKQLEVIFPPELERVRVNKTSLVLRYGEQSCVVAHDFGVTVFIGVPEAERKRVMDRVLAVCTRETRPPLLESFLVELRPGSRPSALFDRVVLAEQAAHDSGQFGAARRLGPAQTLLATGRSRAGPDRARAGARVRARLSLSAALGSSTQQTRSTRCPSALVERPHAPQFSGDFCACAARLRGVYPQYASHAGLFTGRRRCPEPR